MKLSHTFGSLLLLAVFATSAQAQAQAQAGKTREQVRAELYEAIRTGDMLAGDSGRTLYEQFPERYAKARAASQVTPVAAAASAPLR